MFLSSTSSRSALAMRPSFARTDVLSISIDSAESPQLLRYNRCSEMFWSMGSMRIKPRGPMALSLSPISMRPGDWENARAKRSITSRPSSVMRPAMQSSKLTMVNVDPNSSKKGSRTSIASRVQERQLKSKAWSFAPSVEAMSARKRSMISWACSAWMTTFRFPPAIRKSGVGILRISLFTCVLAKYE